MTGQLASGFCSTFWTVECEQNSRLRDLPAVKGPGFFWANRRIKALRACRWKPVMSSVGRSGRQGRSIVGLLPWIVPLNEWDGRSALREPVGVDCEILGSPAAQHAIGSPGNEPSPPAASGQRSVQPRRRQSPNGDPHPQSGSAKRLRKLTIADNPANEEPGLGATGRTREWRGRQMLGIVASHGRWIGETCSKMGWM